MRPQFVGSTSNVGGCPTLYRTERGTLLVQGSTVIDPEALAEIRRHGNGIPAYETVVEVPAELLRFVDIVALPEVELDATRPEFVINSAALPAHP